MSKEKTRDDKLREAAEKLIPILQTKVQSGRGWFDKNLDVRQKAIKFAKSKEAAEYHQSLQTVVDVEILMERFRLWYTASPDDNDDAKEVFNWFLPRLQPPAPESDAVDFAKWILKKEFTRDRHNEGIWYSNEGWGVRKTSSQLYTEYKQSKTNSDEQDKK